MQMNPKSRLGVYILVSIFQFSKSYICTLYMFKSFVTILTNLKNKYKNNLFGIELIQNICNYSGNIGATLLQPYICVSFQISAFFSPPPAEICALHVEKIILQCVNESGGTSEQIVFLICIGGWFVFQTKRGSGHGGKLARGCLFEQFLYIFLDSKHTKSGSAKRNATFIKTNHKRSTSSSCVISI